MKHMFLKLSIVVALGAVGSVVKAEESVLCPVAKHGAAMAGGAVTAYALTRLHNAWPIVGDIVTVTALGGAIISLRNDASAFEKQKNTVTLAFLATAVATALMVK